MRGMLVLLLSMSALAGAPAFASAPLSTGEQEVWRRAAPGLSFYAAADPEDRLVALCIEFDGVARWLPDAAISGIDRPVLHEIELIRGMGLWRDDEFVPDREMWGLTLEVPTFVLDADRLVQGPTYSFVLHDGGIPYRVRREYVRQPEGTAFPPGGGGVSSLDEDGVVRRLDEQWLAIDPKTLRGESCRPPDAPAYTYLWSDDRDADVDLDRDGTADRVRLGISGTGVALLFHIGGREAPMIQIPYDASEQFGLCRPGEGAPTLRLEPQTEAPLEALGALPAGYEVCDQCRQVVVSGGECDPLHFYWNVDDERIDWWRE